MEIASNEQWSAYFTVMVLGGYSRQQTFFRFLERKPWQHFTCTRNQVWDPHLVSILILDWAYVGISLFAFTKFRDNFIKNQMFSFWVVPKNSWLLLMTYSNFNYLWDSGKARNTISEFESRKQILHIKYIGKDSCCSSIIACSSTLYN